MSPVEPTSDASSTQSLTLPELIFSCGICQATVSEVYATPESNKGFHSGSGDDDGIVTRLWIAECSHVSCGKHLAGGAAPFHPHGEQPQAPCPQCIQTGDKTPKSLYGIRGLDEGEHDPSIPRTWFQCPPIRLDGSAPGMDAVRFQYMALARYSQKAQARWKTAETKYATAAQSLSRERKQRNQLQEDLSLARLQTIDDAAALAKSQAAVKKWEQRMPVINGLMAAIKPMTEDMNIMRSKLTELGFDVPRRRYGIGDDSPVADENDAETSDRHDNGQPRVHEINNSSSSSRKRKRTHDETSSGNIPHRPVDRNPQRMSSREMMPPPPPQIRQRNEMQLCAPTLPAEMATQHHEIYNRSPKVAASQHPTEKIGHSKRPADNRTLDMSNPPIRFQPTNVNLARHVYDRQMHDPIAHDEFADFATIDRPLESSFGVNQRPTVNQQFYMPQSSGSQLIDRTGRFTHTRDTAIEPHPQRSTRQPLRPVHVNDTGLQTPKRTSYPRAGPKPFVSPLRAGQPTAGSISSPFFQREASSSHIVSRRRPPPLGGDMNQPHSQRGFPLEATAKPQWLHVSNGTSNTQDRFERPVRQSLQGDYGSSEPPSTATLPYRGSAAASQNSGHLQPSYSNHAYASSMNPPIERQSNPASRGRITLPPSKSIFQDYELSSIRGLRGGYPQRAEGFSSQQPSGYTESRPLFSAASRRSVRR